MGPPGTEVEEMRCIELANRICHALVHEFEGLTVGDRDDRSPLRGVCWARLRGNLHIPLDGPALGKCGANATDQLGRELPIGVDLEANFSRRARLH